MNDSPNRFWIVFPLLALFLVVWLALPRNSKLSYEYRRGQPWKYETLIAPFDFPILKSEEQILEELSKDAAAVVPYYRYDRDLVDRNVRALESIDLGDYNYLLPSVGERLQAIYEGGVVSDQGVAVSGNSATEVIYVQRGKRAATVPASEVYTVSEARRALRDRIAAEAPLVDVDSVFKRNGIYDLLVPNLAYDKQTTDLVHAESQGSVAPTSGFVSAGQLIVSNGEIVTPEIEQMLDSYRKEYASNMGYNNPTILNWLGNALLALAFVVLLFLAVYFCDREVLRQRNLLLYLVIIFAVFLLAGILLPRIDGGLLYMMPFTLCILLLTPFFKDRLILPVYVFALLPLLLYADSGLVIFFVFLIAGVVNMYTFKIFERGWKQFLNGLIVYAVMMAVYMALRFTDVTGWAMLRISIYLFAAAMLPVAGYPLTYLFERIFNLISPYRLRELCDTSNPLLHSLEQKAPGTFQHSLQVMNMATAVSDAIGADTLMVRAGALYHDIGKMQNPICFIENESMLTGSGNERHHAGLSPLQSAKEIVRHVDDGLELAQKHHLPQVVTDFIATHHGTSRQAFFYDKYLKAGGDPSLAHEFEYHGFKPKTKEQVILMLCDSIEAGSRTLKDYSPESFERFVDAIVAGKENAGQLSDAEISLRELGVAKATLRSYLSQMYHERVEYPKLNDKKSSNKK